jgi:hypothetical protein
MYGLDTIKTSKIVTTHKFTCNDPSQFKLYLPTYKRAYKTDTAKKACAGLAKKPDVKALEGCYFDSKDLVKVMVDTEGDTKNGELQMGWLDRVCYKATSAEVKMLKDEDISAVNEADHVPVIVQMEIKPKKKKFFFRSVRAHK